MWIVFLWLAAARAATAAAWESDSLPPPTPDSVAPARAVADTSTGPWFYRGLPYGSESLIHPVRLVLNGGFGILQFDNRNNRFSDLRFRHGWRRLWQDATHPVEAIEVAGWDDFVRREVLPVSTNRKSAQYWPNYTLHLVGGGMTYVTMREWYEAHGFTHPSAWAGASLTVYHVLNEAVEAANRDAYSTDGIADLYLFDPAGVLVFSRPGVARFFGRTLQLRDWSTQPALDPVTGTIENQGQNFALKVPLPRTERWKLFYHFGNHGEAGVTYTKPNGSAFSVGAGLRARSLVELGDGVETADLVPTYGLFYDRTGSLMFSITGANTSRYRVRVNAYPGLVRVFGHTAGLFVLERREGGVVVGLHATGFPLGLAGHP